MTRGGRGLEVGGGLMKRRREFGGGRRGKRVRG